MAQRDELSQLDWVAAWQKIGMTLMSAIGGASGSLYGTLFIALSKAAREQSLDLQSFADIFTKGVDAVKQRGKADAGEKTMLDVYIPVANTCEQRRLIPLHYLKCWRMSRVLQLRVWSLPAICWPPRAALLSWRSAAVVILMRALKPVN